MPSGGTRATVGLVNAEANHGIARDLVSRPPIDTHMSLGTARLLPLPIQDKGLQVIAVPGPPWTTVGAKRRTHHSDLMPGLGRAREELPLGEITVERGAHDALLRRGRRREHLGDQIRLARIAGRGAMDLLAHPMGVALTAVAGFQVVGRGHAHRRERLLVPGAPEPRFPPWDRPAVIVLQPHPPQRLAGGEAREA
jgi:hypothetical protein